MCVLELAGESLAALPERALWWGRTRTLVIGDVHLGKDEGLRMAGAAVPTGPMHSDLNRLTQAIGRCEPERVIIVGDLVHGRLGLTDRVVADVAEWRSRHSCAFVLVPGNHELSVDAGRLEIALDRWGIEPVETALQVGPICFVHDPADAEGPSIAGHVHPSVRVGPGRRLPSFVRFGEVVVLPAFSSFTAGVAVDPRSADDVLCCCEDEVVRLTPDRPTTRSPS